MKRSINTRHVVVIAGAVVVVAGTSVVVVGAAVVVEEAGTAVVSDVVPQAAAKSAAAMRRIPSRFMSISDRAGALGTLLNGRLVPISSVWRLSGFG